jgi:hypothetical protein
MRRLPAICVAVFVAALLATVAAASFRDEVRGTISGLNPDNQEFTLKAEENKFITFLMEEDAPVYVNNEEASLYDLRINDHVRVQGRQDGDVWYAIEVRCDRP